MSIVKKTNIHSTEIIKQALRDCINQLMKVASKKLLVIDPNKIVELTEKLGAIVFILYNQYNKEKEPLDNLMAAFLEDFGKENFTTSTKEKDLATFALAIANARADLGSDIVDQDEMNMLIPTTSYYHIGAEIFHKVANIICNDKCKQLAKENKVSDIANKVKVVLHDKLKQHIAGSYLRLPFYYQDKINDLGALEIPALVLDSSQNNAVTHIIIREHGRVIKRTPTLEESELIMKHAISREHISDMAASLDRIRDQALIKILGEEIENPRTNLWHLCEKHKILLLAELPNGITEEDVLERTEDFYFDTQPLDQHPAYWQTIQQYHTLECFTRLLKNPAVSDKDCIKFIYDIVSAEEQSITETAEASYTHANPSSLMPRNLNSTYSTLPKDSLWSKILKAIKEKLNAWQSMNTLKYFSRTFSRPKIENRELENTFPARRPTLSKPLEFSNSVRDLIRNTATLKDPIEEPEDVLHVTEH